MRKDRDKKVYVLDTSALLSLIEDEPGADKVETIMIDAERGRAEAYVAFVSLTEVFYITLRKRDERAALERIGLIRSLAVKIQESSYELNVLAGKLKASHRISLSDAYIGALCQYLHAILVHKDPEFEQLSGSITQVRLPYKPN